MSVTQAPPIPFGRHLGGAARAARALLDNMLAGEATTYETWIVLSMLATGDSNQRRDEFSRDLAAGLQVGNGAAVAQLLGQLQQFGLIRTLLLPGEDQGPRVEMTAEGEARYQHLYGVVTRASGHVLEGIDPDDLQTTIRVLGQFREGAEAFLAS